VGFIYNNIMKISSIFKDRLYSLPASQGINSVETRIIEKILSKCSEDIDIDKISLVYIEEDYDFYKLESGDRIFDLKFSLDYDSVKFKREIKNVKNSKSILSTRYIDSGEVKIGDKLLFLLTESSYSEPLFDYGRSQLTREFHNFCDCYVDFSKFTNYRITYKTLIKDFLLESDMSSCFDADQISFIEHNSDFGKSKMIIDCLKSEIKDRLQNLPKVYTGNILGDISKNSIFVTGDQFLFKDLRYACKGHVYSDIANMVLFLGLNQDVERSLIKDVSAKMSIEEDRGLYNDFYQIELRKKAIQYLLQYLKEVYLYESSRVETIMNIIDSFSQSYNRLCKIPIFRDNREFITKNITEPILDNNSSS